MGIESRIVSWKLVERYYQTISLKIVNRFLHAWERGTL